MKRLMTSVPGLIFAMGLSGMAVAGSIDSSGAPSSGSGMYTLTQIYDYLNSGIDATPLPGFQEPGAAPAPTMKTTKQIFEGIKAKFAECDTTIADVKEGKKFFSTVPGSWGVRTGTAIVITPTPTITMTPVPTATPTFACGTNTIVYGAKTYHTVLIGSQCWMKENLDYNNGCKEVSWQNYVDKAWCGYYNGTDYGEGLLYQWSVAMMVCPSGWHLPTDAEWGVLESYLSAGTCDLNRYDDFSCDPAGTVLMSATGYGFALPLAGCVAEDHTSVHRLELGMTDSATEQDSNNYWGHGTQVGHEGALRQPRSKVRAGSVRCAKD